MHLGKSGSLHSPPKQLLEIIFQPVIMDNQILYATIIDLALRITTRFIFSSSVIPHIYVNQAVPTDQLAAGVAVQLENFVVHFALCGRDHRFPSPAHTTPHYHDYVIPNPMERESRIGPLHVRMAGRSSFHVVSLLAALALLCRQGDAAAEEFVGCGGFLRSTFPVDFTRVEVSPRRKWAWRKRTGGGGGGPRG